jgi:hypothetical protein
LDEGGHIWLEVEELNISRFVLNIVPREVVKGKTYVSVLITHLDVQIFDVPAYDLLSQQVVSNKCLLFKQV